MLTSLVLASALTLAADNKQLHSIAALAKIDATGKIQQLDWLKPEQVSPSINAFLKPAVLAVEFEPAQKDGHPTYTELLLNVVIEAVERTDGRSDVRFVSVEKAGPRMVHSPMPRFPENMLMRGISAYVMLSVEIGADGRAIVGLIAPAGETPPKEAATLKPFYRSARIALRNAKFDYLENVGGIKIGGQINVPFVFCVDNCDAINAKVAQLRAEQVWISRPSTDVKVASIKQIATPKAAGS